MKQKYSISYSLRRDVIDGIDAYSRKTGLKPNAVIERLWQDCAQRDHVPDFTTSAEAKAFLDKLDAQIEDLAKTRRLVNFTYSELQAAEKGDAAQVSDILSASGANATN